MPEEPRLACDVGAGSGRDANWLAEKGWDVIAVEPAAAFRELAEPGSHPRTSWIDDRLPGLSKLRRLDYRFDLVSAQCRLDALAVATTRAGFSAC